MKTKTIKVSGGAEYAKVSERLKLYNEANMTSKIDTVATPVGEKMIIKATITDRNNKTASGSSFGKVGGAKEYEKLETIAVGRALAYLGYLADGEIASSEEMEEFESYKLEKKQNAIELLNSSKDLNELQENFKSIGQLGADQDVFKVKEELKTKLN